jgi:hypothetical protein
VEPGTFDLYTPQCASIIASSPRSEASPDNDRLRADTWQHASRARDVVAGAEELAVGPTLAVMCQDASRLLAVWLTAREELGRLELEELESARPAEDAVVVADIAWA